MADIKPLIIADTEISSRFLLGTARYPSPSMLANAIETAQPGFVTVALRRAGTEGKDFFTLLKRTGARIVPNTSGCRTSKEACTTARMARELLNTNWIKLEIIANDEFQTPDLFELLDAAKELIADGFVVLAYCTEDLSLCERLASLGCHAIMPWGSPIGSGQGINCPDRLQLLRQLLPNSILIIDAGIGRPSDASLAMELGFDGVLVNSAVATAIDPVAMAAAFAAGVRSGSQAYHAGLMPRHDTAQPSSPAIEFLPPN